MKKSSERAGERQNYKQERRPLVMFLPLSIRLPAHQSIHPASHHTNNRATDELYLALEIPPMLPQKATPLALVVQNSRIIQRPAKVVVGGLVIFVPAS